MALAREETNFEKIKREADIELLVNNMVQANVIVANLKDEQSEMRKEIKRLDETISKLKDDIQFLEKEKRWSMLWRNRLNENIDKTQIVLAIVFSINILFTYFMSR